MNFRAQLAGLTSIIFYVGIAAAEHPTPMQRVQQTVESVVVILKDGTLDSETRWQNIAPVIRDSFNFLGISQSVLATNWDKVTPAERAEFVEYFSRYLELTYREKIEAYTNERITYGEVINLGGFAFVETFIVTDAVKIPVNYKLKEHADGWHAYDVEIEGVSLVSNYRHSFAQIIQTDGIDGLFEYLQGRIDRRNTLLQNAQL